MNFRINQCDIYIEYAFILVLSLAALFSSKQILCLLLFSALHEFGHLAALVICKGKPYELRFSYYGIAIKYYDDLPAAKECAVLLSGPAVNLILYLILKDDINLVLLLLNCLPVYPLDIGRVVRLFSLRLSKVLSIVSLIFVCIFCLYMLIYNKSYSFLFVVIYLVIYSINNY